jgi:hypothetical protein
VRDLLARHDLPIAGAVVVAADVPAMAYYDYYVPGREGYVSQSPGRSAPSTPAPSTPPPAAPVATPRAMSVKSLLPTSSGSANGSNGNGTGAPTD